MVNDSIFESSMDKGKQNQLPIPIVFEAKNFYFKNGRLKYCPPLLSPSHNIQEVPKTKKSHFETRFENLRFLNKVVIQFFKKNKF